MLQGAGVIGNGWQPQVDALVDRYTIITNHNRGITDLLARPFARTEERRDA